MCPAAVLPTHFRMLTAACTPRAFVTLRSTAGQAALQHLTKPSLELVGADAHTPAKRSGASTLGVSARRLPTNYRRLHGSMSPKGETLPSGERCRRKATERGEGTSVGRKRRPLQGLRNTLGLVVGVDAHIDPHTAPLVDS